MKLAPSAHVDTFCRDNLPPQDEWPEFRFDLPELQYPERLNCAVELLDVMIDRLGGERPCLRVPDGTIWSYADLRDHANQVANLLVEDYGLVPGTRVLLRGPNNLGMVTAWFAVLKAGGVVVPTMPLLRPRELKMIGDMGQFTLAMCDARFTKDLANSGIENLTILEWGADDAADMFTASASKSTEFANVDTAADDVSMLAFTSGTTGRPKATMHFHRDVLAIADTFSHYVLKPVKDDVFAGSPPIAFTFGLGGLIIFPLRVGASTLLTEKVTPVQFADLISEHGVTICFTAPTAYRAMISAGNASKLSTLRRAVSAGEHLPAPTWKQFKEATGIELIDGIGSTEMLHIFIGSADEDIRPGSTGKPVPGYQAKIIDDDGNDAPNGTPGRLAVKGPTGCRYMNDPRQHNYVVDGWNLTGDTFSRDDDGYFWYMARSDDMIVSSGYNISGAEVEEAIMTYPGISECAVVAVPDEARGALVKAFIVLKDGLAQVEHPDARDAKVKEIQNHVKDDIAPYKYPRKIEFLEALPRTSTGKVQRFKLREQD